MAFITDPKKLQAIRIGTFLFQAIKSGSAKDLQVFAQTDVDHAFAGSSIWYKAFFFTPHGILYVDTGHESIIAKKLARAIIRTQKLSEISLGQLLHNWHEHDFWDKGRPQATALLREFQEIYHPRSRTPVAERHPMSVQLFKNHQALAIQTDCATEETFVEQFCTVFAEAIHSGAHDGEWEFHLRQWLPQFVELCCAYRGYKSSKVTTKTVYTAGELTPGEPLHHVSDVAGVVTKNGTHSAVEPQS